MLKRCVYCNRILEATHRKTNNKKFCGTSCRNKYYYQKYNRKETQKEYNQQKRLAKFSKNELVQCKVCGKWYRQVGSHVVQAHGWIFRTAREYRELFGFDVKRGQLPKDLKKLYGEQVFENETVKNLKAGKKYWFKKGQQGVGIYQRSEQTKTRLKKQFHKIRPLREKRNMAK